MKKINVGGRNLLCCFDIIFLVFSSPFLKDWSQTQCHQEDGWCTIYPGIHTPCALKKQLPIAPGSKLWQSLTSSCQKPLNIDNKKERDAHSPQPSTRHLQPARHQRVLCISSLQSPKSKLEACFWAPMRIEVASQLLSGCPKTRRTEQQKGVMMNFKLSCNPTLYCHQEKLAKEM